MYALQVAAAVESAAAHVCDVSISATGHHTHHSQNCSYLALLLLSAGLHHSPLHQLHGLHLVSFCYSFIWLALLLSSQSSFHALAAAFCLQLPNPCASPSLVLALHLLVTHIE